MKPVALADESIFSVHAGGKIEIRSRVPLRNERDLCAAYTPGVALVSEAIAADPDLAYRLTMKCNCVAIVTDGSAVLGLGNVGPLAAMPVMEGKAMLFKKFAGVNATPICLSTQDPRAIIEAVKAIAPGFGGICLEDIAAPCCFEVEDALREALDIPVFHDDQHGTAAVALAALLNAAKVVGKKLESLSMVVLGAGAAGIACTKAVQSAGVGDVVVCDRAGAIYPGRAHDMNPVKELLASITNRREVRGAVRDALIGADVFLGVSGPNTIVPEDIRLMAREPIVFALSNPVPEIMPEGAAPYARIIATGRSDYPNQINNVLCFPGLFRGLLDSAARSVTPEMIIAAGHAIAACVPEDELSERRIVPGVFDARVAPAVAAEVSRVARERGLTRPVRQTREPATEDKQS